jgi:SAM-dependent methyltransferase
MFHKFDFFASAFHEQPKLSDMYAFQHLKSFALFGAFVACACACNGDKGRNGPQELPPSLRDTVEAPQRTPGAPGFTEDYINADRVIWQKPEMIINLLGDLQDKVVADIGAGKGFFAFRMAQIAKRVIAIDILPQFIDYLDSVKQLELPEALQYRLETRLAAPDNPRLQPNEVDIVIIVNTYMYIKDRPQYLRTLREGIKDGGALVIVDFKRKRTPIGPPSNLRIPLYQVEEELEAAGYKHIDSNDTALDYQYIVLAKK